MPLPSILLGFLLSTSFAALFHLIRSGSLRQFGTYLLASWGGFWLGDTLGWLLGWHFGAVGYLNTGMASLSALTALLLTDLVLRLRE
jgi:hypothetical protein